MSEPWYYPMPVSSERVEPPPVPKTIKVNVGEHMFIFTEDDFLGGLVVKFDTMTLLEGGIGDFLHRSGQSLDFDLIGRRFDSAMAGDLLSSPAQDVGSSGFSALGGGAFESEAPVLDDLLLRYEPIVPTFLPDIP